MKRKSTEIYDADATLAPSWDAEPVKQRLMTCQVMLKVHGVLTDAEARKVLKRIAKKFSKALSPMNENNP